jgi:protein TonB
MATCGIFVLLPFSDLFTSPPGKTLEIRRIETTEVRRQPPRFRMPASPQPEEPAPEPRQRVQEPRVHNPNRPIEKPRKLSVSLRLTTPEVSGDFALDFEHAPVSARPGKTPEPEPPSPAPSGPFGLEEVDQPPRPVLRPRPLYPYRARRRGVEGYVAVEFTVTVQGKVTNLKIRESVRGDVFIKPVRTALSRWKFRAGREDGRAVAVVVRTKFRFRLE